MARIDPSRFICENPQCPAKGKIFTVTDGDDVFCPQCGKEYDPDTGEMLKKDE